MILGRTSGGILKSHISLLVEYLLDSYLRNDPKLSRIESGADDLYDLSFSGNDVDGWSLRTIGQTLFSPVAWMLLPGQTQPSELRFSAQYIEATRKGSMPDGYSQGTFLGVQSAMALQSELRRRTNLADGSELSL